jgi:hypothetical protein
VNQRTEGSPNAAALCPATSTPAMNAAEPVPRTQPCPSSNGLRQSELFRDGGSGSFGFEIRLLSTDVAIVAV